MPKYDSHGDDQPKRMYSNDDIVDEELRITYKWAAAGKAGRVSLRCPPPDRVDHALLARLLGTTLSDDFDLGEVEL